MYFEPGNSKLVLKSEFKVLIIGFSVTADFKNGFYQKILKKISPESNFVFDAVGIGGIHPNNLVYLFDELISRGYDHVVLEVSTSSFRNLFKNEIDLIWPLVYMLDMICLSKISASVLHLYRRDVDYSKDRYLELVRLLLVFYGFPELDVGRMVNDRGLADCFLVDEVHVNSDGACFYSEAICDFISDISFNSTASGFPLVFDEPVFGHIRPSESELAGQSDNAFWRSGYQCKYFESTPDLDLSIIIESKKYIEIQGFTFISGPRSGRIEMHFWPSGRIKKYNLYDDRSYYERFVVQMTSVEPLGQITVHSESGVPEIELRKGEVDRAVRRNKLVGFLCSQLTLGDVRNRVCMNLGNSLNIKR
jgi:hypothetical protein